MTTDLKIRNLGPEDIQTAIDLAANEGWNPGLEDAAAFLEADQTGFFAGEADGQLVTVISAVRYGHDFGFIGLFITKPEHRAKGYGQLIWDHAMSYLDGRTLGLDAVKEQTPRYAKHGFKPVYRNVRYVGTSTCGTPMDPRLTPLDQDLFPSLQEYDRRFFPAERSDFLKLWTSPTAETRNGFAFVEDGEVQGYGVLRQCGDGYKIGPLFADTPEIAETLFKAFAGKVKGQTVILDTPEPNAAALLLVEKYEMSPEFETFRMYKGPAPDLPLDQMFGITTFELG
ncbi:GNAT family N-acetyltransferase [Roseibium sp.]|uniref:GNAT family N-acetyltransferase n=1 Tax=Roseibium sp. TaxID=1936156 RepID=UPI003B51B049